MINRVALFRTDRYYQNANNEHPYILGDGCVFLATDGTHYLEYAHETSYESPNVEMWRVRISDDLIDSLNNDDEIFEIINPCYQLQPDFLRSLTWRVKLIVQCITNCLLPESEVHRLYMEREFIVPSWGTPLVT